MIYERVLSRLMLSFTDTPVIQYAIAWSSGRQDARYQMATSGHNELTKICFYAVICLGVEAQYDNTGTVLSENNRVIIMNTKYVTS